MISSRLRPPPNKSLDTIQDLLSKKLLLILLVFLALPVLLLVGFSAELYSPVLAEHSNIKIFFFHHHDGASRSIFIADQGKQSQILKAVLKDSKYSADFWSRDTRH